jgi:CheY-like chemotaxis protein
MRKKKVLIVDDNPLAIKFARAKLEKAGYNVITNSGALGTLGIILHENPDYVLMDVMMPGLSGDELVSLILDNKIYKESETEFILFSSKDAKELDELVQKSGAAGAIKKTDNPDHFLSQFESLTSKKES